MQATEVTQEFQQELMTFVDVWLTTKGDLPTPTHFKLKYGISFTAEELAERFNKGLRARGLQTYQVPKVAEPTELPAPANDEEQALVEELAEVKPLPPVGVIAAHLISDVGDKRSKAAKLKSLDLTTSDWEGFITNPDFYEFLCELVDKKFKTYSTTAKVGLGKLLEVGELNAIKYYHEFTGEFKPQQQEVLNLQMIISQLMEIIAKFLSPDQIVQIADQMEGVIANNGQRTNVIETQVKELMEADKNARALGNLF